jgi:hypothetical protein
VQEAPTRIELVEGSLGAKDRKGRKRDKTSGLDGSEDEADLAKTDDDPRSQRGPSRTAPTQPEDAGDEPAD